MPRTTSRFTEPGLAVFGGFLVAFSLPPWGWWPLAFIGIALFEISLGAQPTRAQKFRRGWLFAVGWLLPGMAWMWFLTAPGYPLATAMFGVFHGIAALAAPSGRWRLIGRPAAHTLAEALRFCFPFGGVPLASLAISQSGGPLLSIARVGGALLLTWITLQIGFALTCVVTRERIGAWAVASVCAVFIVSLVAPSGRDIGKALRVAVVQGGGPQGTRAITTEAGIVLERHLAATETITPADGVDVVVWPENVIDVNGIPFAGSPESGLIAKQAARLNAPLVVGITEDAPNDHFLNAQVVVTPQGQATSRYDKVRRVPFGEYMPMRGLLEALGAPTNLVPRDAVSGTTPAFVTLPDETRLAVVISWEVFFSGRARDGVKHGGQLLVNPTNGSSYTWTILQSQQVASSRLRAVETGRWVAQASPTGFSAFISPDGEVFDRTSVSEQRVIIRDMQLRDGLTWTVQIGDKPWVALFAALLGLAWWCSRRSVEAPENPATPPTSP